MLGSDDWVEDTPAMRIIYELLDAHADTARLVAEAADEERWTCHLEYLQRLQRVGRELLAAGLDRTVPGR
jgi:hypothetical protein